MSERHRYQGPRFSVSGPAYPGLRLGIGIMGHDCDGCGRNIVYTCFDDVPANEAVACADVWEELSKTFGPDFHFREPQINGFWDLVFADGWTTANPIGSAPQLSPMDDDQLIVPCGVWSCDLPDVAPDSAPFPNRAKGETAYVKFDRRDHAFEARFVFCDSWGQEAPERLIDYDVPPRRSDCKNAPACYLGRAAFKFHQHEKQRLGLFNENLALHIVRRRLRLWANDGFRPDREGRGALPDGEARLFARFECNVCPLHSLEMMSGAMAAMKDEMTYLGAHMQGAFVE